MTGKDKARQRVKLKATGLSPHSLRHSFVTFVLKGGASIAQTQVAARHTDTATTMCYAHDMDSLDDNAVDYVNYQGTLEQMDDTSIAVLSHEDTVRPRGVAPASTS